MRKIVFRGKEINSKEWVYGFLADIISDRAIIAPEGTALSKAVIPETVGQFTGLCDVNGTEIYEGDIIRWQVSDGTSTAETGFQQGAFMAYVIGIEIKPIPLFLLLENKCDVIGNIHDNPDLLTKK